MKYQAPSGVTAIFCAGAEIATDESGVFDAAESLAEELAAHGCVVRIERDAAAKKGAEAHSRAGRARRDKVD